MKIAAVIPTRGDVDSSLIAARLRSYPEIKDVRFVVGTTPFNRYDVMMELRREYDVFLTQDDDCLTDMRPLIDAYDPDLVVNAMTPQHALQYPGRQTLIGFGAIFHKVALLCFTRYTWTRDALFYRESDRIFGTVNPHKTVFPEIEILPHAHNANRFWKQPDHVPSRIAMEKRIFEVTGIAA